MYRYNTSCCKCQNNTPCENNSNKLEHDCDNYDMVLNVNSNNSCSSCGFKTSKDIFPSNPMLAQSYVPVQFLNKTFTPMCGLKNGTIFPELVNKYFPGQSMMDIDYLRMSSNKDIEMEV